MNCRPITPAFLRAVWDGYDIPMAGPPPLPMPVIPLKEPGEPTASRVTVPKWRWVVAVLLAPVILAVVQTLMVFALGQALEDVPGRYEFVVTIALWALPLGMTLWILRGFVRPKPPKPLKPSNERGFPVVQNQVDR